MSSMNSYFVAGTLLRTPVFKQMDGNGRVATFTIESPRTFHKNSGGSGVEPLVIDCCAYSFAADDVKAAREGDAVVVRGRMRSPRNEDTDVEFPPVEFVVEEFKLQEN